MGYNHHNSRNHWFLFACTATQLFFLNCNLCFINGIARDVHSVPEFDEERKEKVWKEEERKEERWLEYNCSFLCSRVEKKRREEVALSCSRVGEKRKEN